MSIQEFKEYMQKAGRIAADFVGKKQPSTHAVSEMKLILKYEEIPFQEEYKFHPDRKWRFDIALPEYKIAIEYEGLISGKSRHTTIVGFSNDTEKYNAAQELGWKVFRYTALTRANMLRDVRNAINNSNKQ